tara:strand:- start:19893 stop:20048 length:156 start_codon:yes stop_codon:yes gene_type:complete
MKKGNFAIFFKTTLCPFPSSRGEHSLFENTMMIRILPFIKGRDTEEVKTKL